MIRKVEVDEYNDKEVREGAVIVREFAGHCVLTVRDADGSVATAEVLFEDLERAWQAVREK